MPYKKACTAMYKGEASKCLSETDSNLKTRSHKSFFKTVLVLLTGLSLCFDVQQGYAQCAPDITAPVITCPANISTNVTTGYCSANVMVPTPTVTDNCPGTSYSITFAGGNQKVNIDNNAQLQLTGDFTVEAWFRITTLPADWVRIVGKGNSTNRNYGLWYHPTSNLLLFQVYASGGAAYNAQASFTPSLNTWYHVMGVKNGNTYTLYLNGTSLATATGSATPLTSTDSLTIGGATFHARHIGQIDNVRIWKTALSASQASCAYSGYLTANASNLVAHYNMESSSGTTVYDISGNGFNGVLAGGMTSSAWTNTNAPVGAIYLTNNLTSTCNASGTFPVGTTSVVWTATDMSGNSSNCTQTVTVIDNISPTIVCPSNITVSAPSGSCSAVVNYTTPIASDNCSGCLSAPAITGYASLGVYNGFAYYISTSTMTAPNAFTAARSLGGQVATITSAAENTFVRSAATAAGYGVTYFIGINDVATEGVFVGGSGEPISYTNWNAGEPNNSGNEDYTQVFTNGLWNDIGSGATANYILKKSCLTPTLTAGLPSGSAFPVGTTTVTYQASDASGNSTSCSFTVTVNDVTAPTIVCPGNQSINLDASCSAVMPNYLPLVTVSDNCTSTGAITLNQVPAAGSPLTSPGATTVNITATDASGNVSNCTFTLTKVDVTPPVISCPANITVNSTAAMCGAVVTYTVTATDECTGFCAPGSLTGYTLIGTYNGHTYFKSNSSTNWTTANTNALAQGAHLVTIGSSGENSFLSGTGICWTGFTDEGHEGTWTWVTGEPVTYTGWNPGEPNNSGGNENYMHINYGAGGWNDVNGTNSYPSIIEFDCVTTTLTSGYASGSVFPVGVTTVSYTATDAGGNSASCSFTVTVNDVTPPTLVCPANIAVAANPGECNAVVNYNTPVVLDNCGNCSTAPAISGYATLGVYNGYCYYISTSTMTPPNAFTAAASVGGQVATITSAAENSFVRSAANAAGYAVNYVIGINDVAVEGTFVGGSGETISYTNWNTGEPNNSGNEDYTQVYSTGLWNDIGSGGSYNYILKKSCLSATRTGGLPSGSTFPIGTSVISYSAADGSGNTANCSFTVTVSYNATSIGKTVTASPATICSGNSTNINIALSESGISYQLRNNANNASIGSPVTGNGATISLPTGALTTTTTFNILATNPGNGCSYQLTNTATVTVNPLPASPTAGNSGRCGTGAVTITATPGAGETIDWYAASTGGTALLTGNTSYTTPSISATNIYYAQARNTTTGCLAATRTAVTATISNPVAPTAGNNSRCGTGSVTITATPGTGETIDWYSASTGGTLLLSGNTSYTTPPISGTTIYYAQARNIAYGCLSSTRTAVTATVNSQPTVPTGTNGSRCGTGSVTLTAGLTGYQVDWYDAASGGTLLLSGNNSYTTTPISATTIYYAEARNTTTGCVSATRTAVTATVNPLPAAPAAGNNSRCGTGSVTITATPGTGETIDWYSASTGGTLLLNGNTSYTTPSISATTIYYAEARNTTTGCVSATRTAVTATINSNSTITLTSATGTNNQSTCINTPITNITYSIGGSGTGATVSGLPTGVIGNYAAGVFTISGTATVSGTFNYTVTTTGPCTNTTANGTITLSAATVSGTVNDDVICYGGSGILTLTGNTGSVIRWEMSTNNGASWTNISNTTTSLAYSGNTTTTLYRALVQNGGSCGTQVYTNNAKVSIHNLWTGVVSSDWNNPANWSDGSLPTSSCPEVTIPQLSLPYVYPQITSGTASVNNLIIYPSATLTVSNVTLQVAGSITNNGTLDITGGTLELNGTSTAQSIAGSLFLNHTINNIKISNSHGVTLSGTNDTLKITGEVSFGTSNAVLTTNGNLTLVSDATGTASVADMTNNGVYSGNDIIGNVTVERYIPNHPKAWQFLAVPTSGSTIRQSWQEGNATVGSNMHAGYGTIITSNIPGAVSLGFDIYSPAAPSMKSFNASTNAWDGVASTSIPIANKKGYMIFVRGDRTVTTSSAPATALTLRTTGQLYTSGANAPQMTTVPAGKFESIGNPYASTIDFRKLTKSVAPDVADVFYVWDPLLTNTYFGLGGYQTISAANGWKPIPGGTANYNASVPYPYILSGQAFMVHSLGAAGSVAFSETSKVNVQGSVNRPSLAPDEKQFFRASMTTGADLMSDGNVVTFDDNYSNDYEANDAMKIANGNENFGIKRFGINLAIEARHTVQSEDTVYYSIGNMRAGNYKLKFAPANMSGTGLTATLVDRHLSTTTNINLADSTIVPFTVTAAATGSYAADRFYVIFRRAVVLPVTFTKIAASRNNNGTVNVNWNVATETNIARYEIERSYDGRNYTAIGEAAPKVNNGGSASYSFTDKDASAGDNFYRIMSTDRDNSRMYSSTAKVAAIENSGSISVYPNPVKDKKINIRFNNVAVGTYYVQLINSIGQVVHNSTLKISSANFVQTIELGNSFPGGTYELKLISGDGRPIIKQLIIQ